MQQIDFPKEQAIRRDTPNDQGIRYVLDQERASSDAGSNQRCDVSPEALAVKFAYYSGRPLLVTGEPGVGKSHLAHLVAAILETRLLVKVVDSRTEPHDLMYEYDAVARLAVAQAMGSVKQSEREEALDPGKFLRPGVLWRAFDPDYAKRQDENVSKRVVSKAGEATREPPLPEKISVVLIDEIDKASADVPNALLDALGDGRFDLPFDLGCVRAKTENAPLVIITSNNERALPKPFIRRCVVHEILFPNDAERLMARARVHFSETDEEKPSGDPTEKLYRTAANLLIGVRKELNDRGYRPGVAEYLDLLRSVVRWPYEAEKKGELLETLAPLAFSKGSKSIFGTNH